MLRYLTDSNLGGVEKLCISGAVAGMNKSKPAITCLDVGAKDAALIAPMSLIYIKGWTRSVAALAVLLAAFEDEGVFQAREISNIGSCFWQPFRDRQCQTRSKRAILIFFRLAMRRSQSRK